MSETPKQNIKGYVLSVASLAKLNLSCHISIRCYQKSPRCSHSQVLFKTVFLKILQNSKEIISVGVFFLNKIADLECFLLKFTKILKIHFLRNSSRRLFLDWFFVLYSYLVLLVIRFRKGISISVPGKTSTTGTLLPPTSPPPPLKRLGLG